MSKTILITGATDGIGRVTAEQLATQGHTLLLHGRSASKLDDVVNALRSDSGNAIQGYVADLSDLSAVASMANTLSADHDVIDVVINNAGVYVTNAPITEQGLDVRFVVNTIAPYLLTRRLLSRIPADGRIVNLSSAAQAPVDVKALAGHARLSDGAAYAQSKLAITMWSREMALELGAEGPVVVAVNPGSLLGSKMVKEAFGTVRADVSVGAEILTRAALDTSFADATGKYFDNDSGRFAPPHADGLDTEKCQKVVSMIERILAESGHSLAASN
ncbi:MAG: SDR family NAD(P)-dependent oxidoreductase [Pseudomonadota bacterium]